MWWGDAVRSTVVDYLSASTLRRRLLSGSTWALGGKIGAATIGIVTNGVLARLLTKQEFGVYFLAFSIISLGAVIGSLGLPKTVLRFVAENMTLGQPGRARRAIYTALGLGALGALSVLCPRSNHRAYCWLDGDLGDARDYGRDVQGVPRHPYGHPVRRPGHGGQECRPDYEDHAARLLSAVGVDERMGHRLENRHAGLHRLGRRELALGRFVLAQEDRLARYAGYGESDKCGRRAARRLPDTDHLPDLVHPTIGGGPLDLGHFPFGRGGRGLRRGLPAGSPYRDAAPAHEPRAATHHCGDVRPGQNGRAGGHAAQLQHLVRRPVPVGPDSVHALGRADTGSGVRLWLPERCVGAGVAERRETRCRLGRVLRGGAPVYGPPGIDAAR